MNDATRKRPPPRTTYSRKPPTQSAPQSAPYRASKRRRLSHGDSAPTSSPPRRSSPPAASEAEDSAVLSSDTHASSPPPPPLKKKQQFTFFTRAPASSSSRPAASTTTSTTAAATTTTTTAALSTQRGRLPKRKQKKQKQKQTHLTQLTLDLGQQLQTTCRDCGMSYHPSTPDDELLHKRFHAKSVGGVDCALQTTNTNNTVVWKADEGSEYVLMVGRNSSSAQKRKAKEVLEVVDSELGAAEIEDGVLWAQGWSERFKVYLYVKGKKCIGLCLAERIKRAYPVLTNTENKERPSSVEGQEEQQQEAARGAEVASSSSISVAENPQPALLGISRIWTCSSHRRQGVAARLLECARETFIYGMRLEKNMVAFSQPTESGGALARSWFGDADGDGRGRGLERWGVYVEEA